MPSMANSSIEISKQEFKTLYVRYGESQGWTEDYWNHFFENETGKRYFFTEPKEPNQTRMFIDSGADTRRIYLLSEEAEESFFETS
jgi:hypothetical protein